MPSYRWLLIGLVVAIPAAASAEPGKGAAEASATAHSLFLAARTAMENGAYEEACPKLEESMRLDPALGTQLNLADCYEHVGKLASAWVTFLDAAAMARSVPQREKLARARARALEPRLPKLVIDADASAEPGLEVLRDGTTIGSASWGTPLVIDPGSHDVVASAPGKMSWRTVVDLKEGQVTRVAVPRKLLVRVDSRRVASR